MWSSTSTRKGQVTIPKAIRDRLQVREGETVRFVMRGDDVILKGAHGTILDLQGSVNPSSHPEHFDQIRAAMKKTTAKKAARP